MSQNAYDYSYELRKARQTKISRSVLLVVCIFLFVSLFLNYILFPVRTKSKSMEGSVFCGSNLFVCPLDKTPARGQIVFLSPIDNPKLSGYKKFMRTLVKFVSFQQVDLFSSDSLMTGSTSVRRVVALPGDTFYMKDYIMYIKPKGQDYFLTEFELAQKPYDVHIFSIPVEWDGMGPSSHLPERTLGDNEYFVLDDNRIETIDSRLYGNVSSSRIRGRVIMQYFPFNKIRFF